MCYEMLGQETWPLLYMPRVKGISSSHLLIEKEIHGTELSFEMAKLLLSVSMEHDDDHMGTISGKRKQLFLFCITFML